MSIITDILLASFLLFIIELSCLSERPLLIALLICFNCATVSSPADNFLTRLSLYFFDKNTFFNNPNFFLGTSVFSILNLSDFFLSFCAFLYAHSNSSSHLFLHSHFTTLCREVIFFYFATSCREVIFSCFATSCRKSFFLFSVSNVF